MNCSNLIGDRSRFYLHCLTPSPSRNGVNSGACKSFFFSIRSNILQAPLFTMKHWWRYISLARAHARAVLPGKCALDTHNRDYVKYHVDMLCPKHCINRYADQVQDVVLWVAQKLRKMAKNPPRGLQQDGGVLVLPHTQSASNFAPPPMFVLS